MIVPLRRKGTNQKGFFISEFLIFISLSLVLIGAFYKIISVLLQIEQQGREMFRIQSNQILAVQILNKDLMKTGYSFPFDLQQRVVGEIANSVSNRVGDALPVIYQHDNEQVALMGDRNCLNNVVNTTDLMLANTYFVTPRESSLSLQPELQCLSFTRTQATRSSIVQGVAHLAVRYSQDGQQGIGSTSSDSNNSQIYYASFDQVSNFRQIRAIIYSLRVEGTSSIDRGRSLQMWGSTHQVSTPTSWITQTVQLF